MRYPARSCHTLSYYTSHSTWWQASIAWRVRPLLQSHRQVGWEQGGAAADHREVGNLMTDAPYASAGEQVIVPPGHGWSTEDSCRGNALPHPTEALHHHPEPLSRSDKNALFHKEFGSEARSSDLCGLRMRDIPHGVLSHTTYSYIQFHKLFYFGYSMFLHPLHLQGTAG